MLTAQNDPQASVAGSSADSTDAVTSFQSSPAVAATNAEENLANVSKLVAALSPDDLAKSQAPGPAAVPPVSPVSFSQTPLSQNPLSQNPATASPLAPAGSLDFTSSPFPASPPSAAANQVTPLGMSIADISGQAATPVMGQQSPETAEVPDLQSEVAEAAPTETEASESVPTAAPESAVPTENFQEKITAIKEAEPEMTSSSSDAAMEQPSDNSGEVKSPLSSDSPSIAAPTAVPASSPTDSLPKANTGNLPSTHSFVDILIQQGKLAADQLAVLFDESLESGKSLEVLLLERKLANSAEIAQAKAAYNHVEYIDLTTVGTDPEALNLIDEVIAKRYKALPFALDREANAVKMAMADPLDLSATEFLKQKTGHDIQAFYADPEQLDRAISERYSQSLSSEVTEALKTTTQYQTRKQEGVELNTSGQILRDAPINRIVENILDYAIKSRASDIHIEPQIGRVRVRYRIDGILVEKLILPKSVHEAIVSRIKIMSNLKIDEKRLPQDGRFNYVSQGKEIDLRVSTLPTVHGEKIVMRLLEKNINVPSLEDLGLDGIALRHVESTIKVPHGIILITGPTGSGKTTTLYSILHMVNNTGVNIMTLEDPVEYQIPGVNQVQVNVKAGLTFASGLRSFLRQDPNIIMVGEIRDNETADLAIQASLTGHLVFSTLHTNSAAGALPRLMDMKAEPFLLASSMLLTMGQRVVRKINPAYVEEYKPEPKVLEDIQKVLGKHFEDWCREHKKNPQDVTLFRAKAERPSTEPDYKGRIGIFEVMPISPEISNLILKRSSSAEIEEMAIKQGMLLMKQDGYLKALNGVTTIEEVLRVAEVQQAETEVTELPPTEETS